MATGHILWTKRPELTVIMMDDIYHRSPDTAALFKSTRPHPSPAYLELLADLMFDVEHEGDHDEKRLRSIDRRMTLVFKQHRAFVDVFNETPDWERDELLYEERVKCPWFDYLDELMKAHSYNIERDDWVEGLDHPPPPPAPAPILAAQAPFYYQDNQMQGVDHHDANYNAVAGPAYPVAAPAPPPPPPAAVAPVIAPRARSPSPLIAVCDMCDEVLIDLSNSQREAHLTACFPDANVSLADCIVCGVVLDGMEEVDKETHVDRCLKGEGGVAMKETFPFVYPRFGRPADEACTVCFEEFAVHEQLTILSCHCLYHSSCIEEWNSTSAGRFCPVHRD